MAKNYPYFKFVAMEWLTGDIVFEDFELQGIFINICAVYWHRDGNVTFEDLNNRLKSDRLASLKNRFFDVNSDGKVCIKFLDEQLKEIEKTSIQNSLNGKKGAQSKRNKATAKQTPSETQAKKNKNKDKEYIYPNVEEVVIYFKENGYREDVARNAFEYYSVANWHDGKGNKVLNWKQKMRSVWFKPENEIGKNNGYQPLIAVI